MRKTENHIIMTTDLTGIPRLGHDKAMHDLVSLRNRAADIVALQGMEHLAFWAGMVMVFNSDDWDRWPRRPFQKCWESPILWQKRLWTFVEDSHCNNDAGLNAVLLQHNDTRMRVWVRNTRYPSDPEHWKIHNGRDMYCLQDLATSGYPVLSVGNYHRPEHLVLGLGVGGREVTYVGTAENEYVMMLDGLGEKLILQHQTVVPDYRLYNHTGARSVVFRMQGPDMEEADV